MKRSQLHLILTVSALGLSIISFLVVVDGAADEPYLVFRAWDAIVQIGFAMILMLLWFQLAAGMIAGVVRRQVSAWWLLLLAWVPVCESYLFDNTNGYIQDIMRYTATSH